MFSKSYELFIWSFPVGAKHTENLVLMLREKQNILETK